jgi:hypothetical protein
MSVPMLVEYAHPRKTSKESELKNKIETKLSKLQDSAHHLTLVVWIPT